MLFYLFVFYNFDSSRCSSSRPGLFVTGCREPLSPIMGSSRLIRDHQAPRHTTSRHLGTLPVGTGAATAVLPGSIPIEAVLYLYCRSTIAATTAVCPATTLPVIF